MKTLITILQNTLFPVLATMDSSIKKPSDILLCSEDSLSDGHFKLFNNSKDTGLVVEFYSALLPNKDLPIQLFDNHLVELKSFLASIEPNPMFCNLTRNRGNKQIITINKSKPRTVATSFPGLD